MSLSYSIMSWLWIVAGMLFNLVLVLACMVLFRREKVSSWLMLVGALVLALMDSLPILCHLLGFVEYHFMMSAARSLVWYRALGFGLWLVGLMLHARESRSGQRRLAELETLVADQQARLNAHS